MEFCQTFFKNPKSANQQSKGVDEYDIYEEFDHDKSVPLEERPELK